MQRKAGMVMEWRMQRKTGQVMERRKEGVMKRAVKKAMQKIMKRVKERAMQKQKLMMVTQYEHLIVRLAKLSSESSQWRNILRRGVG